MTAFDRPQWSPSLHGGIVVLAIAASVITVTGLQAFHSVLGP